MIYFLSLFTNMSTIRKALANTYSQRPVLYHNYATQEALMLREEADKNHVKRGTGKDRDKAVLKNKL
jgi:hypothetical protein